MNRVRRNRLIAVGFLVVGTAATAGLVLTALSENINLFYPPDQIVGGAAPTDTRIRAGGMVEDGSVERHAESLAVRFVLTDHAGSSFPVEYTGILPDLFREGQGILVTGQLREDGVFSAQEVLAKHDENYMPPEIAHLKTAQEAAGGAPSAASPFEAGPPVGSPYGVRPGAGGYPGAAEPEAAVQSGGGR